MELKHVINKDEDKRAVTMLLYGDIGNKIDGDYFANELTYLSENYDEINIRINSGGGSVMQGLSIFNAILNSKAFITAYIDGVAASMAGVIPMAADKVKINDFARIMIHNPFYSNSNNLTSKEKKALSNFQDILSSLLSRRGVDKEKINELMAAETWFKADEALNLKLVDEIVDTGKLKKVNNELASIAAQNITHELFNNFLINTEKNMNLISNLFGLENATEKEIVAQIKALQLENTNLKAKNTENEAALATYKQKEADEAKKEAETLVDNAIKAGYFDESKRADLLTVANASIETFKTLVANLKPVTASLTAAINNAQSNAQNNETKDFDWYRKNDVQALQEMEVKEPEKFKKLYEAWENAQ